MAETIADPPVTIMVSRDVSPANRDLFEAAMRELTDRSLGYAGHLGVTVFRPAAGEAAYRILFKFDSQTNYESWRASPEVAGLIAKVDGLTEEKASVAVLNGLESWFTLPGITPKPPPRPKMALVTWAALFPLVSLLLTVLQPVLSRVPFLVGTLIVTGLVTVLMTYVVMPRLTRLLARWLFARRG
ncbi:MAG: antibiotic biosynthesis monooxygenase [Magnetospirillum sp.]|nr:antibiotic biosynthesis monooxygenase [Magnetospirillum sp.]